MARKLYKVQRKRTTHDCVLVRADSEEDARHKVENPYFHKHGFKDDPNYHTRCSVVVQAVHEAETGAKQFDHEDIYDTGTEYTHRYSFNGAMVSACSPLLDDCDDNYDVTRLLKKEHVVRKGTQCDPESCSVYFNFKTKKSAHSFIDRLNKFLRKRHDQVQTGKTFSVSYAA